MQLARLDFTQEMRTVPEGTPVTGMPLTVYLAEAVEAARFGQRRWHAEDELPGLESVAGQLPAATFAEMLDLVAQVHEAQTGFLLASRPVSSAPLLARARFVLSEIEAALDFLLDDGKKDVADQQWANVKKGWQGRSADLLAAALWSYGAFAAEHRDRLAGLGGFDPGLIDEAEPLAHKLLAIPPVWSRLSEEQRHKLIRRNALLQLLHRRLQRVRKAAQFVFRAHKQIAREATSAHARRRKAARKSPPTTTPPAQSAPQQ